MNLYADMLFTGGPVYTADPNGPKWVEAVAVADGRILAVGRAAELAELRGPKTEVVDLRGRLLLPGFTESHVHFIELSFRVAEIDVTEARSADEVAQAVAAKIAATQSRSDDDRWVLGGGWNANIWTGGVQPHRRVLDAVSGDVPGGVIERDADGEPTGILRENAVELVSRVIPQPTLDAAVTAVRDAIPGMWQTGIIALHNANDSCDALAFRTYQALHKQGRLGLRVLQHIPVCNLEHARLVGLRSGLGDAWLRVGGVKMFADGALGSRTASMLQPFTGEPDNWGVPTTDPEEMLELATVACESGLNLTIHAIGDRANRDVLNVLAEVRPLAPELRHRIEHVQCIHPDDLPRLAQLDIIASVQPIHATSDMLIVDRFWGPERASGAYAFRRLLDSGAHLVFGSDGHIEPHAPLTGIHAAVTRRRQDGTPGMEGWQGQERITVAEAVDAYTYWPAYAAGEESYRGSITPGKVADLVVLGENIFETDPMSIYAAPVEMTVLDGCAVWRAGS